MRPPPVQWLRAVLAGVALACICFATPAAWAQTRIACVGEAMTHSAHREYDPEYPELMGEYLDDDFQVDASVANPMSGGMLQGSGTNFVIGNYGIPKGSGLDHPDTDKAESTLRHPHLERAEQFAPEVVVIGPYGPHEPYAEVPVSEYGTHFRRLVERVLAFESSPIVLISLPLPREAVDNNTDRRHVYDGTLQVAEEMGLPIIDLWTPFLGNAAEFSSQNKLTLEGRTHMAQIVGDAVLAALADAPEPMGAGGAPNEGGMGGTAMGTDDDMPNGPSTGGAEAADAGAPASDGTPSSTGTPSGDDAPVVPADDTPAGDGSSGTEPASAPTSSETGDPVVPDVPTEEPATGTTTDPATGPAPVSTNPATAPAAAPTNSEGAGLALSSDNSGDAGGCAVAFETAGAFETARERSFNGLLLALGLIGVIGVRRRR